MRYNFNSFFLTGTVYTGKVSEKRIRKLAPNFFEKVLDKIDELDLLYED